TACSSPPLVEEPPETFLELEDAERAVARGADPEGFAPFLEASLRSDDIDLRERAIRTAARIRPRTAARLLGERLDVEEDPALRDEIVWALGRLGDDESARIVVDEAMSEDPRARSAAAAALGCAGPRAAGTLQRLLDDPCPAVRREAALAFARHPDLDAGDALLAALRREREERDERLRWAAVKAIAGRPALAARSAGLLAKAAGDPSFLCGIFALEVLPRLEGEAGIEAAIEVLGDPRRFWLHRVAARRALESWRARGDLPRGVEERVRTALERTAEIRPPATALVAPEERGDGGDALGAPPAPLPAMERRGRPLPKIVLRAHGRGEMILELEALRAPLSARWLRERLRSGAMRKIRPLRADPLAGIVLPLPPVGSSELPPPPEPHRGAIRRGTLLLRSSGPDEMQLEIAGVPRPELEGRVTVLGRALLGVRLLDAIGPGDDVSLEEY
ncbi:MAG: HEAT repeat domain-containing protein, partial [Planctomycetes bacterium]|nr:HEAT repeat domain-containing protein [Planctomycetota bacterium]